MPKIRMPDGQLVNFSDEWSSEDIKQAITSKFPELEPPDYSEERTALGQVGETLKAIPRGFGRTLLTAAEGVGELADAATNVVGLENLIDSGDDNALVSAARQGQKALNDSWLGVDDAYQDAWMTKFGEGLGSMATFLTPTGALRLAGVAGRATKSTAALASALGTGTATERVQRARDEGKEVSGGQEDTAALVGAIIGLSELAPVNRLLRHLDPNLLTPAQKATVMQKLSSAFTMGGVEALQEVSADLAQDLTEQKIYNPDVDFGAEALDSFTIGGAVGFTADLVLSAMAGRRAVTNKKTQETDELGKREGERQGAEIRKRQFESVDTLRGGRPVAEIDPATIEPQSEDMGSYARDIAGTLGRNFPTDTSFTVEQVDIPLTEQELALQPEQRDAEGQPLGVPLSTTKPAFQVYDSKRQAYGTPRVEHEQAAMLAGTLNRQIVDQTARNTVSETVETTPEQYDEATIATLEVIGNRVKNPRANEITADDLNMAAETTVDKGFDENLSAEQAMQRNMGRVFTEPDMVNSLTAAQRVNRKRLADGMPETSTFTVEEAKDVLGDQFGRLGDIGAGGILETQRYSVSQDRRGNPVVLSTAGEVITTDRIERRRKRDGKPYVQKRRIKTEDQAQRLAERLNTRYDRAVDEVVFEDIKAGNEEIKALLERKNIPNELDSPAIKTMAKAFVGKENVNDMDTGEKKFFYQKIRKLPVVPSPLVEGLPDFNQTATLTEDTTVTEEPLELPTPDQQLASDELVVEMQERLDAELKRKNLAGKGVTGKIFQQFRNYGLNKAGEPVFTGEVETAEGAYLKDFNQIAFGIQQAIAGKDVDMNDSDAVFAAIKDVLNHETVHALRALDLFTAEEYQVLETAAENTKRKGEKITYLADIEANPGYEDLSRTQKMEEAIAELVRQNTTLGGRPRTIINKIKDTLEAIARWITGSSPGVKRIVESIESGEIGGREAGEVRTLRATREELDLYEYEDIEGTPSGRRMIGDTSEELEAQLEGVPEVEGTAELDEQPIARSTVTNNKFLERFLKGEAGHRIVVGEPSYNEYGEKIEDNHFRKRQEERGITSEQIEQALRYGAMYKAYPAGENRPAALIFKGAETTVVAQLRGRELVLKTTYLTDKPPMREGTQQRASDDHWEGDSAIAYSRRRVGTTGQYVGAPRALDSPQKLASLRKSIRKLAEEGEYGKFWYERSGRQILDLVNGDINEADKLVQAIAVTSAQTPVAANFDYALQAYYQNKMGQPIKTGKTPVAQSKKLNDIFAGKDWAGRKTNNFYNNLMRVIDPSRTQGVTTDLWMMRAFGYFQSSPTDAQYDFVEGETARLAEELGWEPQQVQAAIWVALKSKAEAKPVKAKAEEISLRKGWMKYKTRKTPEGKTVRERVILDKEKHAKNWLEQALKHSPTLEEKESAKFDYADATTRNLAQISWESIPGSTTGHMAETFEADYPVLQDYHVEISKAFLDNQGNDIVAAELGMLSPMEFEAPGHYEGKVSPGTQTGVTIPKGYKIDQQASPEGKRLMDAYSAAKGILLKQDAMGYHKPFYTKNLTRPKANGILIDIGRPFSEAETIELGRLLRETSGHGDFNPIGDVNGTRLINFSEASNKDFHNIVNTAMRSIEFDDGAEFVGELFVADTGYLENNWEENRNGEGYLEDGLRGQPDLQRKVRDIVTLLQPRVEAVEEEFANKYGWTRNAEINRAYREDIAPELASPPEFPTPRAIPPAEVEAAVEQNLEALENTTGGAVPTFSVKASPEAQAVARNPDLGAKLTEDQNIFYSRTRPSDPETRAAVDKVIQPESRKKGFLESWLPGGKEEGDTYKSQFSKFRQGFINRYEPLEKMDQMMRKTLNTLADSSAYFGMIMSDRSKNMTAGSLKGGIVDYSEGMFKTKDFIYQSERDKKLGIKPRKIDGFLGVLKPLMPSENVFGENLIEVFQALAIAKRAKEINDSGKLSPVAKGEEAAYLAEMEAQAAKYINPETGQSYITEVYEMYQAYNNEVIKLMQKAGLITDEEAQSWSRSAVYYPFYKDFGADPDAETNQETADGKPIKVDSILNIGVESSPSFLPQEKIGSQKLRRLEGSRLKIDVPPLEAMVQNLDAAINMSMKNIAYQRAMRDAVYLGFASKIEKGRKMKALKKGEGSYDIYIREKGRDVHYKVHDPLLFAALTPIADGSLVTAITAVTSIPARFLRESITRSPGFMFVNMERDTLSAFVTSGASFIPVLDTAKNFFADLTEYENLGIITGYDNINDPKDLAAFLKKEMRKKGIDTGASKGTQAWENSLGRVWDLLGKGTQKSDFATRKAVYDDVLARTGSQAEAAFQAIEVLNFGRRGGNTAYRMIAAATPFLNARIQGLDILWRTGLGTYSSRSDLGKAQIQRNALLRAGYLTALTAFYWLLVSDDDQYKEASDYVRDNNWLIPNPFGPEPFKVPTPFEIGLLFKTMPEKVLDATFKEATARDLTQTAARGIGSTLEMNPLGMFQITAPLVEVAVNKNFYTGRQIVPYYIDQGVVKGLQDRVTTTQFAQWLGQSTGMSPLKIDHMLNGYAGSLGMLFIDATDYILRNPAITGDFSASMPTRTLSDHPVTRRFFAREEGTGLAQDFYEMDRYVGQAVQTLNKLEEEGRIEEYQKFLYGREHLVDLQKDFNKISRDLGEFREAKQQIMRMDIHPDSKRDQIKEIDREMNELLSIVPMLKELVRLPVIREGTFKEGGP